MSRRRWLRLYRAAAYKIHEERGRGEHRDTIRRHRALYCGRSISIDFICGKALVAPCHEQLDDRLSPRPAASAAGHCAVPRRVDRVSVARTPNMELRQSPDSAPTPRRTNMLASKAVSAAGSMPRSGFASDLLARLRRLLPRSLNRRLPLLRSGDVTEQLKVLRCGEVEIQRSRPGCSLETHMVHTTEAETLAVIRVSGRPAPLAMQHAEAAIHFAIAPTRWEATGGAFLRLHAPPTVLRFPGRFEVAVPVAERAPGAATLPSHRARQEAATPSSPLLH